MELPSATVDQDQDQSQSIPQPAQPGWTNTATNPAATQEQYTHTTTIDSDTHSASPDMSGNSEVNTILTASRIQNLQYLNLTSFVLTSMIVIGVVFWGVREEGVWSDDYSWMRYQVRIVLYDTVLYRTVLIWFLLKHSIVSSFFYLTNNDNSSSHHTLTHIYIMLSHSPYIIHSLFKNNPILDTYLHPHQINNTNTPAYTTLLFRQPPQLQTTTTATITTTITTTTRRQQ